MRYDLKQGLYWFHRDGTLATFGLAESLRRPPMRLRPKKVLIDVFNPNPVGVPLPIHSLVVPIIGMAEARLRRLKGEHVVTCYWASDGGRAMALFLAGLQHKPSAEAYAFACHSALEPAWARLKETDTKALVAQSIQGWRPTLHQWGVTFEEIIYESELQKFPLEGPHPLRVGGPQAGFFLTRSDGTPLYTYADYVSARALGPAYDQVLSFTGIDQKLYGEKLMNLLAAEGYPTRRFRCVPLIRIHGEKMSKRRGNTIVADSFGPLERLIFRWICLRRSGDHLDLDLDRLVETPEAPKVQRLLQLLRKPLGSRVDRSCLWLYYNVAALSLRQILDRIEVVTPGFDQESSSILWCFLEVLGLASDLRSLL